MNSNSTSSKIKNCKLFESNNIQLAWLSLEGYQKNRLEFIKKYQKSLIAKISNDTLSKSSTICIFDMTTKTCGAELIHPMKADYENEIFLLVQLLPLTYTIFDINYKIWTNATNPDHESSMGKIILNNFENANEKIYDTIRYGFHEKIIFNSAEIVQNLKGQYEYNDNYIDINEHGIGSVYRKLNYTFSHVLPPRSFVNVSLIGVWADHNYEIASAVLQFEYGSGYVTTKHIENFKILVSKILHLRTEFTNPMSLDTNELIEFHYEQMNAKTSALKSSDIIIMDDYHTQQGSIYPGFHPYFIAGCIIVGGVIFVGLFSVCRSLMNDKKERKYRQVPTYRS